MKKIFFAFILALACAFFACPAFAAYQPPSSEIIVFVDSEGGVRKDISNMSRVPVFCLYKDGRLIYSTVGEDGLIFLMDTKLSEDKISEVRKFFDSSDEWNDVYDDTPMKNMPCVNITYNSGTETRKFSVRGIDYAMKQKTIPSELAAFYRYVAYFSDPEAEEYECDDIMFFAKSVPAPDKDSLHRIISWKTNIDLEDFTSDAGMAGIASSKLSGKQAKKVVRTIKYQVPYMTADLPVYIRQKKNYYSVAYRPLLPHELSK